MARATFYFFFYLVPHPTDTSHEQMVPVLLLVYNTGVIQVELGKCCLVRKTNVHTFTPSKPGLQRNNRPSAFLYLLRRHLSMTYGYKVVTFSSRTF